MNTEIMGGYGREREESEQKREKIDFAVLQGAKYQHSQNFLGFWELTAIPVNVLG